MPCFAACAKQEAGRARFLGEHHVVKAGVRRGERREFLTHAVGVPVESARIDEQSADHGAMSGQELRRRVHDEIGAVLEGTHQPRRRERRIDEQRQAVAVRNVGHARDVEHLEPRIAECLGEQKPRLRPDRGRPRLEIARIDERRLDAEARQRVIEQIVRAAVKRARSSR